MQKILQLFTDIEDHEIGSTLLLMFNVFLLLCAYYFIKPVREALILTLENGAVYKSYASAAIALLLLGIVPLYGAFADRWQRNRLIVAVSAFFAANLGLFFAIGQVEAWRGYLAIPFYLWVGVFNLMVVAQFWSFANDVFSEEQGKRLFALIGFGASAGAAFGSKLASALVPLVGVYGLLILSAALLLLSALITQIVHTRESGLAATQSAPSSTSDEPAAGGFRLVLQTPYLRLIAVLTLLFTLINTNGEFLLGTFVSDFANQAAAAGTLGGLSKGDFIGKFYGDFFFVVNIVGMLMQLFLVSRIIKFGGLKLGMFLLPVLVALGYTAFLIVPTIMVLRVAKTVENSTDYSLNNTVRNMLWLPTTREMKYKAKQAIDTFVVRSGDVVSALCVFTLIELANVSTHTFAIITVVLVGIWLALIPATLRENQRLSQEGA